MQFPSATTSANAADAIPGGVSAPPPRFAREIAASANRGAVRRSEQEWTHGRVRKPGSVDRAAHRRSALENDARGKNLPALHALRLPAAAEGRSAQADMERR